MLHQTLLSFQPFSPSSLHNSLPSPSASAARLASPQAEMKLSASDQAFLADQETEDLAWDRTNLLCEDFHVEDLLDLRALSEFEENEEPPTVTEPNLPPPKSPLCAQNNPLELFSEISLQDADAASLEWLSRFFDDISKEFPSPSPPPLPNQNPQPKYHSLGSRAPARVKSKRSKRLRGSSAVWARSSSLKLADYSSASSITSLTASSPTRSSSSSSSFSSSFNSYEASHEQKKRGRKRKNAFFSQAERRCTHCGVHKTPQWRAGPQGAKTLCNACGVRYKSGRLLPEYRPACSPTFVGSIHSNSHRKVLEMRRKNDEQIGLAQPARAVSSC